MQQLHLAIARFAFATDRAITGRELPSAAGGSRKPFTLYVSAKGKVTGDYAGSAVEFSAENSDPASVTSASVVPATQVAAR